MITKTLDVLVSMEGGFPIVLETIDSENIEFSLKRQERWSKIYEDVHLFSGIPYIKDNKEGEK